MEPLSIEQALYEVRKAQRILVAYHQRVKDIVLTLRGALGVRFCYWHTQQFFPPGQQDTDILHPDKWCWDLMPLSDVSLLHSNSTDPLRAGALNDLLLEVRVVTDSVFIGGDKDRAQEPDPLALGDCRQADSYLELIAYQPKVLDGEHHWLHHWHHIYRRPQQLGTLTETGHWRAYSERLMFAELLTVDAVIARAERFQAALRANGFALKDD